MDKQKLFQDARFAIPEIARQAATVFELLSWEWSGEKKMVVPDSASIAVSLERLLRHCEESAESATTFCSGRLFVRKDEEDESI